MSISLQCPKCGSGFKAKDKLAGKRVKCPMCSGVIDVPLSAGPTAPPALPPDPSGAFRAEAPPAHRAADVSTPKSPPPAPQSPPPPPGLPPIGGASPPPPPPLAAIRPGAAPPPPPPPPPFQPMSAPPPVPPGMGGDPAWTTPQWTDDDQQQPAVVPPSPGNWTDSVFGEPERASVPRRMAGYLIDVLPTLILIPVIWIPIIGQVFCGVLLLLYWLLRDTRGASLGKWAMGMEVRDASGRPSIGGQRIFRNITFSVYPFILILLGIGSILAIVIPPLLVIVNVFGMAVVFGVNFVIVLAELCMLIFTGRRLGDRIAGTIVVKLPPPSST